jgi:hypothetical protein
VAAGVDDRPGVLGDDSVGVTIDRGRQKIDVRARNPRPAQETASMSFDPVLARPARRFA